MPLPLLIAAASAIVRAGGIAAASYGVAKAVHDYKQHNNGERFATDMAAALEPGLYGPFSGMSDIRDFIQDLDPESLIKLSKDLGKLLRPIDDMMKGLEDKFNNAGKVTSPIILDLDGDGVETVAVTSGVWLDHAGDGFAEQTGWVGKDDGLLVRDLNGNGQIDTGAELFGSETQLANGQKAANGFAALAALDTNLDGKLNASDTAFATLRIWKDADGDGYTSAGELLTLTDASVQSINVGYTNSSLVDANGNAHKQIGSYTTSAGQTRAAEDVWFQTDTAYSIATTWLDVPADIAAMPDATGYGKVYDLHQAMVRDTSGSLKNLVTQFTQATTVDSRQTLLQSVLYRWSGADAYSSSSRGSYITDGRMLYAVEAFLGEKFTQYAGTNAGTANPGPNAAAEIVAAYNQLFEMVYGQLAAQSFLKPFYDNISFVWDRSENIGSGLAKQHSPLHLWIFITPYHPAHRRIVHPEVLRYSQHGVLT